MIESSQSKPQMREQRMAERFAREFAGSVATHCVHAPGRVNLIGEHTDYNGLSVFPMAIQRDVALVFRARGDSRVQLANVDARFGARSFELSSSIERFAQGDWGNYAKAAAQMLAERFDLRVGIDAVVDGDIPVAAGLSSSSALVVACALALLTANGVELERSKLADIAARGERYVGVQGGGMDQAICLHGRRGYALVIDFEPLRLRPTAVPPDWRFVIANSLVRADKSGGARDAYNLRTKQCREALRIVSDRSGARDEPLRYRDIVSTRSQDEWLAIARESLDGTLLRRFSHVVSEGARVEIAREAMTRGDLVAFGAAMNASHASLRDDYEVSCPELDRLVAIAREAGAAGARLSGAGFGGCIVAACRTAQVPAMLEALERDFYRALDCPPADRTLIAEPSDGARVSAI